MYLFKNQSKSLLNFKDACQVSHVRFKLKEFVPDFSEKYF